MKYKYNAFTPPPTEEQKADQLIAKIRSQAVEAEMRRYIRAEVRETMRHDMENAFREQGFDLGEPQERVTTGQIVVASARLALDIPRILLMLGLYSIIIWLMYTLVRVLVFKA